jgi:hypothetical protein
MSAPVRVSWAHVTLAEYAALDILRHADPESVLNRVWDDIHEHNPFRGESPDRLSDSGRVWLADLRDTVATTLDERDEQTAARDMVKSLGTLTVTAAHRLIRTGAPR